jgi:PAS domain S-box-containing protein
MSVMRERDLMQAMAALPVPAYIVEIAGLRFLATNKPFQDLLGYSDAELMEMSIETIRPAEDIPLLHRALSESPPQGFSKWRYLKKDGTVIYATLHYRHVECLRDSGERIQCRCVVIEYWDEQPLRAA